MIHIKQLIRSIKKYKTSTLFSLTSLVISFVGVFILVLFVSFDKSFDRFHKNKDQVYRFETLSYGSQVPAVANELFKENLSKIESSTVLSFNQAKISLPSSDKNEDLGTTSLLYSDNSFFDIFTFPLILGDKENILKEPNTVVLSESLSKKIFAEENPLGKIILFDNEQYKVDAIMQDFPENSSFSANCIASFKTMQKDGRQGANSWSEWSFNIYVKTLPNTTSSEVVKEIEQISIFSEMVENNTRFPNQDFLKLVPLSKIHNIHDNNYRTSEALISNVLLLLAIILAIMGGVNFVNFSTSQASLRIKALSVNQVLGSKRIGVIKQVLGESVLISIIAFVVSFGIYELIHQPIESLFNIQGLHLSGRFHILALFFLFILLFAVITGLYPAIYATSSPIHQSIKGKVEFAGKGNSIRNILVTTQLVFTIALIASALIIEKQLDFWRNFDLGINKEHVIYMPVPPELRNHYQAFADELMKNNNITNYTYAQFIPGQVYMGWGRNVDGKDISVKCWPVDDNFIDFFEINIKEGRKFEKNSKVDINTFILNEKAAEDIGWENPLEYEFPGFGFRGKVVGIADDFNFSSLKENILPMVLWRTDTRKNKLLLRISGGNVTQTFSYIKETIQNFSPSAKVEVRFLDEALNDLYLREVNMARFIEFVAAWCILLAITGLLGLIIFISRNRIKEIGIRKVNGAKIAEILSMINKEFIRWVIVAFIISCPIAWYAMNKWLENFAYKTEISWWVFVIAGAIALFIALITVSWQCWRAAIRNPVEALRYE